jgi:hypothetical protein
MESLSPRAGSDRPPVSPTSPDGYVPAPVRIIGRADPAGTGLPQLSCHTGRGRCLWSPLIPAFLTEQVRGLKAHGKARQIASFPVTLCIIMFETLH